MFTSKIDFIYPLADIFSPKTGGQVYDLNLLNEIKSITDCVNVLDNDKLSVKSRKDLAIGLFRFFPKLGRHDIVIFNSAWFVYFIPFLLIIRFFKPHVKTFAIHHHFRYFEFNGLGRWLRCFLEKLCLRLCTGVISPNPYTTEILCRFIKKSRIHNLRMSFKPSLHKSEPKSGELLFVGTLYKRKGIHFLLKALAEVHKRNINFHLKLVGSVDDEHYVAELKSKIKAYGLGNKVKILGRVNSYELDRLYSYASWFVLPSLHEGYGMVIAEAMSYGIPVIAFDNSAIPFLVKDRYNGLLVRDQNIEHLTQIISEALNNDQLRHQLSLNARLTFDKLPKSTDFKEDVEKFIKEIVNE